jgi:hypothetical protein
MIPLAQVDLNPNPGGLPGSEVLQGFVDGLGFWGLLASLACLVAGAVMYAFGALSTNSRAASVGKSGAVGAVVAALLIGGAAALVQFFYGAGGNI